MSIINDPVLSEGMIQYLNDFEIKKKNLEDVKADIKENPDIRYLNRKTLAREVKELEVVICEVLNDGDEVTVGHRLFKKQRVERTKYTKERVHAFCEYKGINVSLYADENMEEHIGLKVVIK